MNYFPVVIYFYILYFKYPCVEIVNCLINYKKKTLQNKLLNAHLITNICFKNEILSQVNIKKNFALTTKVN